MPHPTARVVAALAAAALAFGLYFTTLLPGQDLGDTASFQSIAGDRYVTPRDGYPLYFAVTGLFVRALPMERARAANLASAVLSSAAVAFTVIVAAELAGAVLPGLFAGLLLAASYTFWSQAIIAEVYALHLLVMTFCLLALLQWARKPSLPRLAVVFLLVGLGFGNHLSMVLLLPGFAVFLLVSAPSGPATLLAPRVVLLAVGVAAACSLQYAWNLTTVGDSLRMLGLSEFARDAWFDITKSDWRSSMVAGIPAQRMSDRLAMYWFDLRQQVGIPGAAAAALGASWLLATHWRRGLLLLLLWSATWAFAITYNVGDVHVFFLPSHLITCLWAGCGAAALIAMLRKATRSRAAMAPAVVTASVALLVYPCWRAWDTWPALNRSQDTSAHEFLDALTGDLSAGREVMAADLEWQLHNGLTYYARHRREDLPVAQVPLVLLHFPFLVWENRKLGRDVVLTRDAASIVSDTYGPLFALERDTRPAAPPLPARLADLAPGTAYVMTMLKAYRERAVDPAVLAEAAEKLSGRPSTLPPGDYAVMAGLAGSAPTLLRGDNRPFRATVMLNGRRIDIRMESWLSTDTIRRAGFGHVIAGRRRVLTIDRGISFVALGPGGEILARTWEGGILTPQPRFRIRSSQLQ